MVDPRQAAAIKKALTLGGSALVHRVRFGLYRVASSTREGRYHTVTVNAQGRYACDCEAGLAGHPCWAQAAVYVAKVEHASKGRVVSPAEKGN